MASNSGCGLSAGTMSESVMSEGTSICVPIGHEFVTKEVMKDSLIKDWRIEQMILTLWKSPHLCDGDDI